MPGLCDMFLAAWVLLQALFWCAHAHAAPVPPLAAALEPPAQGLGPAHSEEGSFGPPEKRLLKYILPRSQAWMSGEDTAVPTGQEGTKRGYSSRNYLRFGRSDEEKRGGRNFLRFGRGDVSDYEAGEDDVDDAIEKRGRNFLRFGRNPSRNFLRFGRPDVEEGPMEFAEGFQDEAEGLPVEEKRAAHKNYLRFGRGNRNFLRFGRGDNRNFLRFGRSVDRQMAPIACEGCEEMEIPSAASPSPNKSRASEASEPRDSEARRQKRAAPGYYDFAAPTSWAMEFQPREDLLDSSSSSSEELQDVDKRNYNRSFLRFGRNRNFLRFGKRDNPDSASDEPSGPIVVVRPVEYPRFVRAPQKNFLRFG